MPSRKRPSAAADGQSLRRITVTSRSSRTDVRVAYDRSISVRVTAPPADGAANRAVVGALAAALSLPPGSIKIVRGATARQKLVRFTVSPEELNRRLDSLAAKSVHDPTV